MEVLVVLLLSVALSLGNPTQKKALLVAVREEVKQLNELMDVVEAEKRQDAEEDDVEAGKGEAKWKQLSDMGLPPPLQRPAEDRVYDLCPPGYIFVKETRGCYKIMYDLENWKDALEICAQDGEGGSLVTFNSATEELFVHNIIHAYSSGNCASFWTSGFYYVENDNQQWMWYNGGFDFEYTHWAPTRPTSVIGAADRCMNLLTPRLMWTDSNCGVKKCFICEARSRTRN
ncbi:hypothetical protein CAPTEDRAFT_192675 [Capitella teleta]|uniref:C-type lectin domain-containing protein n=1 Tax=Capitella teleta TaxID=283909 RepID=R7TZS4_CAPTE|nr:hypothetical protein CAPTEDRAFT_192675 [Capitella teleta]|eukprot:ELT96435.1 hypothetical protein CAPTEDRAFT_192675 [Capitella teleta]